MRENKRLMLRWLSIVVAATFFLSGITSISVGVQEVIVELPEGMSPQWRGYFERVDFDGDGIPYIYDKYLGRDDNTIDYEAKQGGTWKFMSSDISTLDPIMVTDTASHAVLGKIFENLVDYVPASTDVMPGLAKAWDISEDGKVYTFYLREDVKFHDGSDFNADDVVYSLERFMDPSHASKRISFGTDYVDHVEKVDDYTVKIYLKFPFAPFLTLCTYSSYMILPKEYTEAHERFEEGRWIKDWTKRPIGTGPYEFVYWNPGAGWKVEANDDYWGGRPYLDAIQQIVQEDEETIIQAFKAGQVYTSGNPRGIPPAHWEEFTTQSPYKENIMYVVTLGTYWYKLNCDKWPFDNVLIRQAVACALNREGVLETVFKGRDIPAHGPIPLGCFGYSQELYDSYEFTYNPEKAKALLDEAGAIDTDGDGIREYQGKPLQFEISAYVSETWKEGAKTFKANLKEVGIDVRYQEYDFNTILDMTESGNFVMCSLGWIMDYPDPENFYILWETKGIPYLNSARYSNPEYDEMVQEFRVMTDPIARKELCHEIEKILIDDHPHIWFYHPREPTCVQPYLHDWAYGPNGWQVEKWLNTWLDEEYR